MLGRGRCSVLMNHAGMFMSETDLRSPQFNLENAKHVHCDEHHAHALRLALFMLGEKEPIIYNLKVRLRALLVGRVIVSIFHFGLSHEQPDRSTTID